MTINRQSRCILFDWGDTVMKNFSQYSGPMFEWPVVEALPHAREALEILHPGWTIALATNSGDSTEEEIRLALKRCELDPLVDRIYCFRKIGYRKPSLEFFQYILNDLDFASDAVLFVGDDFEADVLGANQAGIRSIWLNSNSDEKRTSRLYRTIQNLIALPTLLKEWP